MGELGGNYHDRLKRGDMRRGDAERLAAEMLGFDVTLSPATVAENKFAGIDMKAEINFQTKKRGRACDSDFCAEWFHADLGEAGQRVHTRSYHPEGFSVEAASGWVDEDGERRCARWHILLYQDTKCVRSIPRVAHDWAWKHDRTKGAVSRAREMLGARGHLPGYTSLQDGFSLIRAHTIKDGEDPYSTYSIGIPWGLIPHGRFELPKPGEPSDSLFTAESIFQCVRGVLGANAMPEDDAA